jgi:hypothetical protein
MTGMSPLPAVATPEGEHEQRLALIHLARDFARNIKPKEAILSERGLTAEQYDQILNNPFYQRVLEAETETFQAAGNTPERIKYEAAVTLEEYLPELHLRMHDQSTPLNQAIEGAKLLAKLAGVGEEKVQEGGSKEKIIIQINLGEDKKLSYEHQPAAPTLLENEPDGEFHDNARLGVAKSS